MVFDIIEIMESLISSLTLWIAPVFLIWVLIPSQWLNHRAANVGRIAEILAWLGLVATTTAFIISGLSGQSVVIETLTNQLFFGVRFDIISGILLLLVTFLGAIILRYSRNYLQGDKTQGYFFKWMCFTLGSVMALIVAPGLVQFMLAWATTSLGLHKLLVYFPDRLGTLLSARKKFIVSRVGDISLLGAFVGIYTLYGVQDFTSIFQAVSLESVESLNSHAWIGWLIVAGAILKSAQFPFHTWLPDTMGTPTPVSALMHAGIINAGGYLIVRMSPFLVHTPLALYALAIIGTITAVFASFVMLTQTSIKRKLAYSTIAQMGFMLLQCGLGAFPLAILHIVAHSLYKAHAFLSSGSTVEVTKALGSNQPITKMSRRSLLLSLMISATFIIGLVSGFGIESSEKPGIVVFSTVLALALTQFIWVRISWDNSKLEIAKTLGMSLSFAALYFALSSLSISIMGVSLPAVALNHEGLEYTIAIVLFVSLFSTVWIQSKPKVYQNMMASLYIHSLNGFYINTIVNRLCRSLGLVPNNR